MRLRQYVKFQVWSKTLDPEQLTARIGLEADETRVMGSKQQRPKPVPRSHWWEVKCDTRRVDVRTQVTELTARIAPSRTALRELLASGEADGQLKIVRWFGEEDGDEEVGIAVGNDGSVLREGVDLFGWYLERPELEFLVDVGAELIVEEYDMLQNEANFGWPDES